MNITTNADVVGAKLSESLSVLAKLTGFSERTVGRSEVGIILKSCARLAKPATAEKLERSARIRAVQSTTMPVHITVNAGIRGQYGRVWRFTRMEKWQLAGKLGENGGFIANYYHYKDQDWRDIMTAAMDVEAAVNRQVPLAQRASGLSRQAFVQMADDIGIKLEDVQGGGSLSASAIAKARAAIATNGRGYRNGIGSEVYEEGKRYLATLIDQLPYLYKTKPSHDVIIQGVVTGRAKFFEKNMQLGVFNSMATTAKKYPWLRAEGLPLAG